MGGEMREAAEAPDIAASCVDSTTTAARAGVIEVAVDLGVTSDVRPPSRGDTPTGLPLSAWAGALRRWTSPKAAIPSTRGTATSSGIQLFRRGRVSEMDLVVGA